MKIYVSNYHNFNNGKTLVEGVRYIKNTDSKTPYDKFLGQYVSISVDTASFSKYLNINYNIPLILDVSFIKGKGALINTPYKVIDE